MTQHRGQGLSTVLGHPQEVDPGLLKTKADWTGRPQASRQCRSAHPTHVSRNGSQMTAWPPGDTLVLTWPKLQLKGGVGAGLWRGRAGQLHWSCGTRAFSTHEGLDSVFRAVAI